MIETVQERQRGARDFGGYYESVCALQESCPVAAVRAHLADGVLDINGDRIRQQDWSPIFSSIKINKNLKFIAVRSHFQLNLDENIPEKKAKVMRSRIPVIRMKDMTSALCKSLRDCLSCTENLECLELQGIHLRESHVSLLGQGIMKNSTLKHLSLEGCRVADSGLSLLCAAMKMAGNISTLDLTSCNLSAVGIHALADLIKFQAMSRHNEAWKESLRYRWANFDTMIGLRRMTLNKNLTICDDGALILAESLKDDLWVKAIDLQECGLSSESVRAFLKVLKFNSTLVVLDLRRNPLIDRDLLKSVTEQVLINGYGKEIEYQWLRVEDTTHSLQDNYDRHPRSYYDGPSKPLEPESRPVFKPAGRLRSRSASSLDRRSVTDRRGGGGDESGSHRTPRSSSRGVSVSKAPKGQPWRTAIRATRYKGYPPDHVPGKSNLEEHYDESPGIILPKDTKVVYSPQRGTSKNKKKMSSSISSARSNADEEKSNSVVSPLVEGASHHPPLPETLKELKTEIFHLRTQLDKYRNEKNDTDQKLKEIYNENCRLRNTVNVMTKTHSFIAQKSEKSSVLQDEAILETIEDSFQQFSAFLDMLRQSGFSRIVTAAGMDNFITSKQIFDKIHAPAKDAPNNMSSGTSVSSIKHNGSSPSLRPDQTNPFVQENGAQNDGYGKDLEKSPSRSGAKSSKYNGNGAHEGGAGKRDLGSRLVVNEDDHSELEIVGWKEDSEEGVPRTTPRNMTKLTDDNDHALEPLSWQNVGKGKEKRTKDATTKDSGDILDDDLFEEVGWKKNDVPKSRPIDMAAGDQELTIRMPTVVVDTSRMNGGHENQDSLSPKEELADISDKMVNSFKRDSNHHQQQQPPLVSRDLNVEDIESFSSDNSENGLANDPGVDNQYYQQASLDAAQELSTDTSFNYGY